MPDAATAAGPGRMPDPATIPRPWIAHYPPGVPPTYRYPDVPLTRFLDDAARDFPDTVATSFLGAELTYAELRDQVDRTAAALQDLGVGAGDRVAVVLPNLPAAVVATFAVLRLGAIVVHPNAGSDDDELTRELVDSGARVAVVLGSAAPRFRDARADVPALEHVVTTDLEDWLPWRGRMMSRLTRRWGGRGAGRRGRHGPGEPHRLAELVAGAAPVGRQTPVGRDDLALLQYTAGGTTGTPKAVALTHGNLVANAFQARLWVPDIQAGKERLLAVLPFAHVYGLTLGMLTGVLAAATLVLLPRFDVDEVLDTIDARRPTLFPGVPAMYRQIALHPEAGQHDLRSIRACVSGGASLPADLARRFEEITGGARLREGYGLSESSPLTHANPIYGRSGTGTIGLPVTDTVAIVVDPDDPTRRRPAGEPGELAVAGPQVMRGYWHAGGTAEDRPDLTADALRDGWLLTGDRAVQHHDGTFSLVDAAASASARAVTAYPPEEATG